MDAIFLAAALGVMLFSSALLAPLIFAKLSPDAAGPLLRAFWPRYYVVTGVFAVLAAVFALQDGPGYTAIPSVVRPGGSPLRATPVEDFRAVWAAGGGVLCDVATDGVTGLLELDVRLTLLHPVAAPPAPPPQEGAA